MKTSTTSMSQSSGSGRCDDRSPISRIASLTSVAAASVMALIALSGSGPVPAMRASLSLPGRRQCCAELAYLRAWDDGPFAEPALSGEISLARLTECGWPSSWGWLVARSFVACALGPQEVQGG